MSKRSDPPMSNWALGGVAFLFVMTVGILGGLFMNLRSNASAMLPKPAPVLVAPTAKSGDETVTAARPTADDDAPVIRVAMKADATDTPAAVAAKEEVAAQPVAVPADVPAQKEAAPSEDKPSRFGTSTFTMPTAAKDMSDELVPDIKGPSYTAKKAAANGGDAYANMKPDNKPGAVKKPEVKKPLTPAPAVPPTAAKASTPAPSSATKPPASPSAVAKSDMAKPPALPPIDPKKMDVSKAPVYVLIDGRRIRAVIVRENGAMISVRNETGTEINFKKTDIKEILRNG